MSEDKNYVLGIDPGLKGGITLYHPDGITALRTPVLETEYVKKGKKAKRNIMDLESICDILSNENIAHAYLEQVNAMPGQGVTSMFRFGQNMGQWEGLLAGLRIPVSLVRPQEWKKYHKLIGGEKENSFELVQSLFPDNTEEFKFKRADEGRAESTLIAMYGWDAFYGDN